MVECSKMPVVKAFFWQSDTERMKKFLEAKDWIDDREHHPASDTLALMKLVFTMPEHDEQICVIVPARAQKGTVRWDAPFSLPEHVTVISTHWRPLAGYGCA